MKLMELVKLSIPKDLEMTFKKAFKSGHKKRHEFITVEHLLLVLLDDDSVSKALVACNVNIDKLRQDLTQFIDEKILVAPGIKDVDSEPTIGFWRVFQRAIFRANNSMEIVTTPNLNILLAIFTEKDSHAVTLMHQQSMTKLDAASFILHGTRKDAEQKAVS